MYDKGCIGGMPITFSFAIYAAKNRSTKKNIQTHGKERT